MNKKGFTLIELLVVVLIIGILSAIALPQYATAVEKSRSSEALTLMSSLRYAADRYKLQTGMWPGSWNVLDIEMPYSGTSTNVGGKNFGITTSCTTAAGCNATANYVITAARRQPGPTYSITMTLNPATGQVTRACTGTGTDGTKICNAISSGKPTDF